MTHFATKIYLAHICGSKFVFLAQIMNSVQHQKEYIHEADIIVCFYNNVQVYATLTMNVLRPLGHPCSSALLSRTRLVVQHRIYVHHIIAYRVCNVYVNAQQHIHACSLFSQTTCRRMITAYCSVSVCGCSS